MRWHRRHRDFDANRDSGDEYPEPVPRCDTCGRQGAEHEGEIWYRDVSETLLESLSGARMSRRDILECPLCHLLRVLQADELVPELYELTGTWN